MIHKYSQKVFSFILALILFALSFPIPLESQAAISDVPPMMRFNHVIDSLEYLGYGVERLTNEGRLFQDSATYNWYGSGLIKQTNGEDYLSPLGYDGASSGIETSNGKPNVQKWIKSGGLNCASFVSYFYLNYLPNVAGMNSQSSPGYNTYQYIKTAIENYTLGSDGIHNNGSNKNLPSDWSYQADWMWQQAFNAASTTKGITNSRTGKTTPNTNYQYIKKINAMDYYKELYKINAGTTPTDKQIAQYLNNNTKDYRLNYIKYLSKGNPFSIAKEKEVANKNININQLPKLGDILTPGDLIVMGRYNSNNGSTVDIQKGDNVCFSHVAIYIGDYNGHSFLAHCTGGAEGFERSKILGYDSDGEPEHMGRGVEISTLEDIFNRIPEEGEFRSYPIEFYHVGFKINSGSIKITANDDNGNPLQGAIFNVTHTDSTMNLSFNITTDKYGVATTPPIPYGNYIIKKITTPSGYKEESLTYNGTKYNSTSTITVKINNSAKNATINGTYSLKLTTIYGFNCKINNNGSLTQIPGSVIGLFKKSLVNSYAAGTSYNEIYNENNAYMISVAGECPKEPSKGETKKGLYLFRNVPCGEYVIAKISSPIGYSEPDERSLRPITISDDNYDSFKSPTYNSTSPDGSLWYNEKIRMVGNADGYNGNTGAIRNYTILGNVTLKLTDENSSPLGGAEFELKGSNSTIKSATDKNGTINFTNVPYGEYMLTETKTASTYLPTENEWRVTIDKNGNSIISLLSGTEQNYIIESGKISTIKITKRPNEFIGYNCSNKKPTRNSIFMLECPDGSKMLAHSSAYGIFKFNKLCDGNYELKQLTTKDGYLKNDVSYYFTVENGNISNVKDQYGNTYRKTKIPNNNTTFDINIKIKNVQNKISGYIEKEPSENDSNGIIVGLYYKRNNKLYQSCRTHNYNSTDGYYEFNNVPDGQYYLAEVIYGYKNKNYNIINNVKVRDGIITIYPA